MSMELLELQVSQFSKCKELIFVVYIPVCKNFILYKQKLQAPTSGSTFMAMNSQLLTAIPKKLVVPMRVILVKYCFNYCLLTNFSFRANFPNSILGCSSNLRCNTKCLFCSLFHWKEPGRELVCLVRHNFLFRLVENKKKRAQLGIARKLLPFQNGVLHMLLSIWLLHSRITTLSAKTVAGNTDFWRPTFVKL